MSKHTYKISLEVTVTTEKELNAIKRSIERGIIVQLDNTRAVKLLSDINVVFNESEPKVSQFKQGVEIANEIEAFLKEYTFMDMGDPDFYTNKDAFWLTDVVACLNQGMYHFEFKGSDYSNDGYIHKKGGIMAHTKMMHNLKKFLNI